MIRNSLLCGVAASALLLASSGARAADQVVPAGTTQSNVTLAAGDSLTNNGTINNATTPAIAAVRGNGTINFITNNPGGIITATVNDAVYVSGNLGALTNGGLITTTGVTGVAIQNDLGTFLNTGTISSTGATGVYIFGNLTGSATNSATIRGGAGGYGFAVAGTSTSIVNSGTIEGALSGMVLAGAVSSVTNSGTLQGGPYGLYTGGAAGTVSNSGTIAGSTAGYYAVSSVGSMTNSGLITSDTLGMYVAGTAGTINNSGTIRSSVNANSGLWVNGTLGTLNNSGTISSAAEVGLYLSSFATTINNSGTISGLSGGIYSGNGIGTVVNSGTIKGNLTALRATGNVGTFDNSGTIVSTASRGVNIGGTTGSFTNSGTIIGQDVGVALVGNALSATNSGTLTGTTSNGLNFGANVGTVINTGRISTDSTGATALYIVGTLGTLTNSGVIDNSKATNSAALVVVQPGGTIVNSGTINSGVTAIAVQSPAGTGAGTTIINSGTLSGALRAIQFEGGAGANYNDTLIITTGSKIAGAVNFGGGTDTFDFSGFAGSTILTVPGLELVTPGSRTYVWDKPNNQIAIFDISGIGAGEIGDQLGDVAVATGDLLAAQLAAGSAPPDAVEPTAYAPTRQPTSAEAATVMTAVDTGLPFANKRAWAALLGGGAIVNANSYTSFFGGALGGAHADVNGTFTAGLTGGFVSGGSSSAGGSGLASTTALFGVYGKVAAGPATVNLSLLGAFSNHTSSRTVTAGLATQTATGQFTSFVVIPSIGASAPVASTKFGDISIDGRLTYVGGQTTGYTETGSILNLTVGSQTIGFVDARAGLGISKTFGKATLTAKAGVLAQSNFGGAAVPVTVFGQTINTSSSSGNGVGLYASTGVKASVGTVDLGLDLDGSWRNDGVTAASAKAGVSVSF